MYFKQPFSPRPAPVIIGLHSKFNRLSTDKKQEKSCEQNLSLFYETLELHHILYTVLYMVLFEKYITYST